MQTDSTNGNGKKKRKKKEETRVQVKLLKFIRLGENTRIWFLSEIYLNATMKVNNVAAFLDPLLKLG